MRASRELQASRGLGRPVLREPEKGLRAQLPVLREPEMGLRAQVPALKAGPRIDKLCA